MKRRYRLMIGVGTALGVGFGAEAGFVAFENSLTPGDQLTIQETVALCAPTLGSTAIKSTTLPETCKGAAGYIPYRSQSVEDVDYQREPTLLDNGVTLVSEKRMYTIPTRKDYEAKMKPLIEREHKRDRFNDTFAKAFGSVMGLGIGFSVYGLTRGKSKKYATQVQDEEITA